MKHSIKSLARAVLASLFRTLRRVTGFTPPERVFRHLHFAGVFEITSPKGEQLRLWSWGHRVENELAWRGWNGHEPDARQRWYEMVAGSSGDILDIGANTATFAFQAKCAAPNARVIAFEPLARVAEMARQNVAVSGLDVRIKELAIGREDGSAVLHDPGGDNAYSASLDPDFLDGPKDKRTVAVRSLDSCCAEMGLTPSAIKLDVEGFEADVLLGAKGLLSKGECLILCEWRGASASHAQARELLEKLDYFAVDVATLQPADLRARLDHADRNVLLVPRAQLGRHRALGN